MMMWGIRGMIGEDFRVITDLMYRNVCISAGV